MYLLIIGTCRKTDERRRTEGVRRLSVDGRDTISNRLLSMGSSLLKYITCMSIRSLALAAMEPTKLYLFNNPALKVVEIQR